MSRERGRDGKLPAPAAAPLDGDLDAGEDDPQPARRTPRRPRWSRRRTLAVVVVVAAVVAAASVRGALARESGAPAPALDGTASAEQLFPRLGTDAPPGSEFTDSWLAGSLGIVPGSARLLTALPSAVFWVAQDADGGVCLLARDAADAEGFGGSCASTAEVVERGLRLVAGEGTAVVLVPPGFDTAGLAGEGYVRLLDDLWVDRDSGGAVAEAAVDGASTRIVVVPSADYDGQDALPVFLTDAGAPYAVVLACLQPTAVVLGIAPARRGGPGGLGGQGGQLGGGLRELACGPDVVFQRFTGSGGPTRAVVTVPAGVVWAGQVVACTGTGEDAVC